MIVTDENGAAQSAELTPANGLSAGVGGESAPAPATYAEPWYYGAADVVAVIALIVGVLSLIGGVVLGIELSRYTAIGPFGGSTTQHHTGVIAYWIAIGFASGVLWLALAVLTNLLRDIARATAASLR